MTNHLNNILKPAVTLFTLLFISVATAFTQKNVPVSNNQNRTEDQVFAISDTPDLGTFDMEQDTENHEKCLPSVIVRCFPEEKPGIPLLSKTIKKEATKFSLFLVTQIDLPPPVC